jgi:TolB-like protein/tetratricopeptide (TPR) repeat protein
MHSGDASVESSVQSNTEVGEVDPLLRLRVFGAMEASNWSGESVLPRGRKAQAILAYLAMCEDPVVPRRRLAGLLWSKRWDEQARDSLRQSLMELRRRISAVHSDLLSIEKDRVSLQRSRVWLDGIGIPTHTRPSSAARPSAQLAGTLLESLRGLDPAFDHWIETRRRDFTGSDDAIARIQTSANLAIATRGRDPTLDENFTPDHAERPENRRLTLAVTPLVNIDDDPRTAHLSTALTHEVVTALARFRWFVVRIGSLDEDQRTDYRLEGSVSTAANGYRIAVRLVDCRSHQQAVWTRERHVERTLLQGFLGDVAEQVVEHVDPEILSIETRRVRSKASADCVAYECLLHAIHLVYSFERQNWELARTLLEQAIVKDPRFGRAYAVSAVARSTALSQGWIAPTEAEIGTLDAYATRAIECDPYDSMALAISAHTRLRVKSDFAYAIPTYERALQLNPSCGFAWGYSAIAHGYLGHTAEAMRRLARARELMVCDSFGQFLDSFDMPISFCSRDWARTIALGEQFAERGVQVYNMYKLLVGALCHAGRFDDARRHHRDVMRREPGFSWRRFIAGYPFGREEDRLSLALAIARAGLIDDPTSGPPADASNVVQLSNSGRRQSTHGSRFERGQG